MGRPRYVVGSGAAYSVKSSILASTPPSLHTCAHLRGKSEASSPGRATAVLALGERKETPRLANVMRLVIINPASS
jgi:hypothetical protein